MKVVMAPVNFANQPLTIARELKRQGVDVRLIVYSPSKADIFNFSEGNGVDAVVNLKGKHRLEEQLKTMIHCLEDNVDIFHFWFRTFTYAGGYKPFTGIDLPFIRNHGKKIVYRFTGSDLRNSSQDLQFNPYSAWKYGYKGAFDEKMQKEYIDFLREYVDQFIVQDPELQQFIPEAVIVPRGIDIENFDFVGITETDKPLVVHAPTNDALKGTTFVLKAIEELEREGLKFQFKLIKNMTHSEAVAWYKKCDIAIDQLHLGAYGIVTLECMTLGKPVVVYYREDLFKPVYGEIPVENGNPDNVKEKVKALITDFDRRKELSVKARKFVERHHDVRDVASRLTEVYRHVLLQKDKYPHSHHDIEYLINQVKAFERECRKRGREQALRIVEKEAHGGTTQKNSGRFATLYRKLTGHFARRREAQAKLH